MEDSLGVTQRIFRLFKAVNNLELPTANHKSCCVCGENNLGGFELSEEVVNVLLEALLVEIGEIETTEHSAMWVCAICWSSVSSLVDLFQQLKALRLEFNELRRRVGEKVILGSLGESKEAYESWLMEVNSVEDVFASGAINRLVRTKDNVATAGSSLELIENVLKSEEEDEMFAEEPLELLEYFVDQLEDPKLTKMRATVVLSRLSYITLESQLCKPKLNKTAVALETVNEGSPKKLPYKSGVCLEDSDCNADSISAREVQVNQLLGASDDDDYCPSESESCSSSSESHGVLTRGSEEPVGVVNKGELKTSSEEMILCGYCNLTFPTKLSWKYHRQRIHSLHSAVHIDAQLVSRSHEKSPSIRLPSERGKSAESAASVNDKELPIRIVTGGYTNSNTLKETPSSSKFNLVILEDSNTSSAPSIDNLEGGQTGINTNVSEELRKEISGMIVADQNTTPSSKVCKAQTPDWNNTLELDEDVSSEDLPDDEEDEDVDYLPEDEESEDFSGDEESEDVDFMPQDDGYEDADNVSDDDVGKSGRGVNQYGRVFVSGRPLSDEIRKQIVQLSQDGVRIFEIVKELKVSHGAISKILARYHKTGSFKTGVIGGSKPNKATPLVVNAIQKYKREKPNIIAKDIVRKLLSEGICNRNSVPSISTINRVLRNLAAGKVPRETEIHQETCEGEESAPSKEVQGDSTEVNIGRRVISKLLLKSSRSKGLHSARELEVLDSKAVDEEDQFSEKDSESSGDEYAKKETPCGFCDLTFPTKHLAKEHQNYLHSLDSSNAKTPKCPYCLKMFVKRSNLYRHLSVVHYGIYKEVKVKDENRKKRVYLKNPKERNDPTKIHCSICDKIQKDCFSDVKELKAHSLTETHVVEVKSKINAHCNTCRVGFGDNVDALKNHLESQEHLEELKILGTVNEETFCIPCRLDCGTQKKMRKHRISRKHWNTCSAFMASRVPLNYRKKQNIQCPLCPKKLTNGIWFRKHFRKFHKPGGFVCEICGKAFSVLGDYKSHRKTHAIPKTIACPQCSRMFETVKQLKTHNHKNHSGISLVCPTCGKMFKTKASLENHEQGQHPTVEGRIFKFYCKKCSKGFPDASKQRRHNYKVHMDDLIKHTPHVCLVCFKGFKESDELNVHMAAHDTLKCYFCGKYFEQITNLDNHVRMHIGEKPFGCTYCDKTFGAVHNMQAHMRWHVKMNDKNKTTSHID